VAVIKIGRSQVFYSVFFFILMSLVCGIFGLEYMDERELAGIENQPIIAPAGVVSIVIKVPARILELYNDGALYKKYRIAVGKNDTPTPVGEWNVVWKAYNWGSGFGTRWMGLNVPWGIYGIHGTNKPWTIGQFASHGCIRMRNKDVEELFEWVPIGTGVRIEGRKVKVERVLKYETTGPDVAVLQMKLKELGFFNERADGIFGTKTKMAVEAFQTEHGFEVTGVVNRQLADLLGI
jgi:murein L,D-transpeptidase YcbB/YkuD